MTKQIKKKENKKENKKRYICNICKFPIDEKKEFAEFIHYKNSKSVLSKAYYHIQCFRDRMNGTKEVLKMQKDAQKIMDFAKKTLGITEEEMYEVIN